MKMRSPVRTMLSAAAVVLALFGAPVAPTLMMSGPAFAQDAPAKSFVRDDLQSYSIYLLGELQKRRANQPAGGTDQYLEEGRALQGDNPREALERFISAIVSNPDNGEAWLLFAQTAISIEPKDDSERYTLRDQALNSAYAAYIRLNDKNLEADAVALVGEIQEQQENWRGAINAFKAAVDLKPDPDRQATYDRLVEERGFRIVNYNVDSDSLTPRACVEFSEPLKADVDYQSFVALSGGTGDTAVVPNGSQLCVDGLKHGTRYALVIRQGVPSINEGEVLRKNADYEFFVRDRAPAVRTTGKTYVLPRNGQQGIPVVSVNTDKVSVDVYSVGDRSLAATLQNGEFLSALGSYGVENLRDNRGQKVWSGTLDVKRVQNEDVTTAFPVMQAVPSLKPGVHVLVARPFVERPEGQDEYADYYATQWFVVSDLGLTAIKGNDGLTVLLRSVADANPLADVAVKLVAKNNEILGESKTDANGLARFDAGLTKGEGGLAPGILVASTAGGDYGFLDMQQSAFDFTDRGVAGRTAPTGLDGFLYTERGVYRSGETVNVSALVRDALGQAAPGAPLTLIVTRPDGVEYKRAVSRIRALAAAPSASTCSPARPPAPGRSRPTPM